ncbi:hypothetical protein C8R45DRAFT_1217381 [Mycena sanguinolenta]|nr:hypothetical protein C8R45DRAFT_1217381 [Mycena sanguinolenta]
MAASTVHSLVSLSESLVHLRLETACSPAPAENRNTKRHPAPLLYRCPCIRRETAEVSCSQCLANSSLLADSIRYLLAVRFNSSQCASPSCLYLDRTRSAQRRPRCADSSAHLRLAARLARFSSIVDAGSFPAPLVPAQTVVLPLPFDAPSSFGNLLLSKDLRRLLTCAGVARFGACTFIRAFVLQPAARIRRRHFGAHAVPFRNPFLIRPPHPLRSLTHICFAVKLLPASVASSRSCSSSLSLPPSLNSRRSRIGSSPSSPFSLFVSIATRPPTPRCSVFTPPLLPHLDLALPRYLHSPPIPSRLRRRRTSLAFHYCTLRPVIP